MKIAIFYAMLYAHNLHSSSTNNINAQNSDDIKKQNLLAAKSKIKYSEYINDGPAQNMDYDRNKEYTDIDYSYLYKKMTNSSRKQKQHSRNSFEQS